MPRHDDQGDRCAILSMHVSTVSPEWVYRPGARLPRGHGPASHVQEARSDLDEAILNLRTHQLIGPTNIGFCGVPGANVSGPDLSAVPNAVIVAWGLHPCIGGTSTTATTVVPPTTTTVARSTQPTQPTTASVRIHRMVGDMGRTRTATRNQRGGRRDLDLSGSDRVPQLLVRERTNRHDANSR